ncbi:hypothetical protein NL529_31235, partial [Klebsiella pneumoniae]|nr:hypothetical protein [Klebsiella pneumoniae]
IKPVLQGTLLDVSKSPLVTFTVVDRTPGEEITFYRDIDGALDSDHGPVSTPFSLNLEEGKHTYKVYAEDRQGNRSATISKSVIY